MCSDWGASPDRDSQPVLALGSIDEVYLFALGKPPAERQRIHVCITRDGGLNWGFNGDYSGIASYEKVTAGSNYGSQYVIAAWETWLNPSGPPWIGIDVVNGFRQPSGFDMGGNPSVAFSLATPRFPMIAYQAPRPDGSYNISFASSEDLSSGYKSWSTPQAVVGRSYAPGYSNVTPVVAADANDVVHLAYVRSSGGRGDIYYLRGPHRGASGSWEAEPGRRLSWNATNNHDLAIAASREGNTILVVWTAAGLTSTDLMYAYSLDGGDTFSPALNLTSTPFNEGYPAIAVDPDTSTFHVAYFRSDSIPGRTNNVLYTQASWGDPANWTTPTSVVGAGAVVSGAYPRPAITSFTHNGTHIVKVAWTDARNSSNLDIYAADANPMSCNITANPVSVPPGFPVTFQGTAAGGTQPYVFSWRYGDGATGFGQNTAHSYATPRDYNAVLRVDDAAGNTCLDAVRIHVLPPLPDLAISVPDISFSPPQPFAEGAAIRINATIHNVGGNSSGATYARFHDGVPPSPRIGADQLLPPIPIGGKENVSVVWTAFPPGSHEICVVADPDNLTTEIDKTNNMACATVQVLSLPDLLPMSINVTPSPPLLDGVTVAVNATIANLGDLPARQFDALLLNDKNGDSVPQAGENISLSPVSGLAGHSQADVSFLWRASPAGNHRMCVFADPPPGVVTESNETNNVACTDVLVRPGPPTRPDYVPIQPWPPTPTRIGLSSPLPLSIRVLNQGNGTAVSNATVAFYDELAPAAPFASYTLTPLSPSALSSLLSATWIAPATPGTHHLIADVDYGNNISEWNETNNVYAWVIEVMSGPITSLVIDGPSYTTTVTYVSRISSLDFSVIDQSGMGIRCTMLRVDNGTWINYSATGSFRMTGVGEGDHYIEWYSTDNADNVENVSSIVLRVDATAPVTTLVLGSPSYLVGGNFVNSSTPLALTAFDGGTSPVGVDYTGYRIDGGAWDVYSSPFHLMTEGVHKIEVFSVDHVMNVELTRSESVIVDNSPPTASAQVGEPKHQGAQLFVSSATPIILSAIDGGIVPVGVGRVEYRIDSGPWNSYSLPFNLTGMAGLRTVEYASKDLLGNAASVRSLQLVVDDTPPATTFSVGEPKYLVGGRFVNSSTPLTLNASDIGVGTNSTFYRLWGGSWSSWREYTTPFTLTGRDGTWFVEFLSYDFLGNSKNMKNETLVLDDTPPATSILPATGPYTTATTFNFTATDAGSGVRVTRYSIDGGERTNFTTGFTLSEGGHTISFYSMDNLNNTETERSVEVNVTSTPPPSVEANYKPVVAVIFAIILLVAGVWSSRRRPWKGGKGRAAVLKAFAVCSLPFILTEAVTGIVSSHTGQLSMPPLAGLGTAIDVGVLIFGLAVMAVRTTKTKY